MTQHGKNHITDTPATALRRYMTLCLEQKSAIHYVIDHAQALAQRYGVKVTLSAEGPHELQLVWLERTSGGKGNGSKFLTDLTTLADQHAISIMLAVRDGEPKLVDYYKRFGFEVTYEGSDGDEPVMERPPRNRTAAVL